MLELVGSEGPRLASCPALLMESILCVPEKVSSELDTEKLLPKQPSDKRLGWTQPFPWLAASVGQQPGKRE